MASLMKPQTRQAMDGNRAAAEGARLCRVQVVAAYPITPQTPIVEHVSNDVLAGRIQGKYIATESEHSALSVVVGAAITGVRTFTATAGAGLALMHEIVGVASGNRLPIVMPVSNRALPSPWTLQTDHSDTMAERDQGWIQLYAESAQETLDLVILGYRLAEDERVRLPVMVAQDGFFVSHTTEVVELPAQEDVDAYLPPFKKVGAYLDVTRPMTLNQLTSADVYMDLKYQHQRALLGSLDVLEEVGQEYGERFGRPYGPVDAFACEDAELVLVTMGSMAGTAREAVRRLRAQGEKVGLLKVTAFRPFPHEQVREALAGAARVAVIDRSAGMGSEPPLAAEVKTALYDAPERPIVAPFVAGLGGRDVTVETIDRVVEAARQAEHGVPPTWVDVREVV